MEKDVSARENTIRASVLSSYNDCPRRSATKLFPNTIADAGYRIINPKQNIGAAIGHGVHAALEYSLRTKMEEGNIGYADSAEDVAIKALHDDVQHGVYFDEKTAPNINTAEMQVLRSTRIMRNSVAPGLNPVDVEVEFKATYRDFNIIGHIDVQEESSMGDLKTGKFIRQNAPQYGCYTMLGETSGFRVDSFKEYYIPTLPLDKPAPPAKTMKYDVDLAKEMAQDRLDYIIESFEGFEVNGNPAKFPANPASILCDPKFCAAYGTKFCREHKDAV